jgi:hypothetical protein
MPVVLIRVIIADVVDHLLRHFSIKFIIRLLFIFIILARFIIFV